MTIPWCSNVQLYLINNFDNRETQWIRYPTRTVLRVQSLRAHGYIIIMNCAVWHLSAKLKLEVQVICNKIKWINEQLICLVKFLHVSVQIQYRSTIIVFDKNKTSMKHLGAIPEIFQKEVGWGEKNWNLFLYIHVIDVSHTYIMLLLILACTKKNVYLWFC